jgi:hypothetical protein
MSIYTEDENGNITLVKQDMSISDIVGQVIAASENPACVKDVLVQAAPAEAVLTETPVELGASGVVVS